MSRIVQAALPPGFSSLRLKRLCQLAPERTGLFEMNLEPRALTRRIVGRMGKPNYDNVFFLARFLSAYTLPS